MLAILTARMLTGTMVPTVRMEGVWVVRQVLTALLFFFTQKTLPASILAAETVVLTLILRLLVLTRTAAYLKNVKFPQVTTLTIVNDTTKVCFARAKLMVNSRHYAKFQSTLG